MKKEDISTFQDHKTFLQINGEPYYTCKEINKMFFMGLFIGILLGTIVTLLAFKLCIG